MNKFGEALRAFRQASNDPDRLNRRLSQERLGELIGHEMGDLGFSGAAISDWERGESIINAQDRNVLTALIQVLHKCGGLKTLAQANQFLEAGNYRVLSPDDAQGIFQNVEPVQPVLVEITENKVDFSNGYWWVPFFESPQELYAMLAKAKAGPPPIWPRIMVTVFRSFSDRFSASDAFVFILWVWVWLLTWVLIVPSLRWPFLNREQALHAIILYVAGTIIIPALMGALTNTNENEFWQKESSVKKLNLRLYIHQGASVGFQIGYFFIFIFGLFRHTLGYTSNLRIELAAMVIPVILGYASARLVPYNLLLAYKQLNLKDGAIFFVFFLFGPAWGYFFLEVYDILLTQTIGAFLFLFAMTIVAGHIAWQNHRKDKIIE